MTEISLGLKSKASSVNKIRKFWYFHNAINILLALREHKKGSKVIPDSSRRKSPKCNFSLIFFYFKVCFSAPLWFKEKSEELDPYT